VGNFILQSSSRSMAMDLPLDCILPGGTCLSIFFSIILFGRFTPFLTPTSNNLMPFSLCGGTEALSGGQVYVA
jgi:hypothetical protein